MIIYLDVIWLLNLLLDIMLLLLTRLLAKDNTKIWRIIFGGFFASAIVPVVLYYPTSLFTTIPVKILYSIFIVLFAFRFQSVYRLLKMVLLFYFITFTIGGGLIAIHFLIRGSTYISSDGILMVHEGFGDPVSWIFILVGFPIVWLFTKKRMDEHAFEKMKYNQIYDVTIQIKGISYQTHGFIDSGNQLVDPLTKSPVIVCDEPFLKNWFREDEWEQLKQVNETWDYTKIPIEWQNLIKIIPWQGAGGGHLLMLAFKPDELIVNYEGVEMTTKKVLIGIQFANLTNDGHAHCLLHPKVIQLNTAYSA